MPCWAIILACAVVFSVAVAAAWRLLSRRRVIPCPSFLVWLLENPVMEAVAGSAALMKRAGVETGMRVLDAGCGPGRLTIPLARRVGSKGEVVAVDVQSSMLSKLRDRLERERLTNVQIIHAALGTGALGPNRFDRAFLVTVLGEIPEQENALREIFDHLHPGGILSVTEVLPDPHYQRRSAVQRLARRTGFEAELVYHNFRSYTMNLTRPHSYGSERGPA